MFVKLIVQIPCLNEEDTLPATVKDIPREVPGIDTVEILIVDDGSTDRTVEVARELGVDHIVKFPKNRGLGYAFKAGFDACLKLGADIIINTDGDNQYYGPDIAALVKPILDGKAHIVIGDRQTGAIGHFGFLKRFLQTFGSKMISRLAHVDVPDVASGFRAYSREAALHLSMFTDFDHTAEHVVQAGQDRLAVEIVPIRTNAKTRESRLFKNIGEFVFKSGMISLRTYARYNALRIFTAFGSVAFVAGIILGLRFVYIYFAMPEQSALHVQSLILAAILLLAGFQMFLTGIVADLIATNRALLEDMSTRVRRLELEDQETE
ncbi:MAG: glycosyltransferase involved in cell wall biosynthesis [Candidatus Latescibacterota bacterium]